MKRILFLESSLDPTRGGIQRVSDLLVDYLTNEGYDIFFFYFLVDYIKYPAEKKHKLDFSKSYDSFEKEFIGFIIFNNIDVIINQDQYHPYLFSCYAKLKKKYSFFLINCFHLSPDYYKYCKSKSVKYQLKSLFYKLILGFDLPTYNKVKMYNLCDSFVLLSNSFISDFKRLYHIDDETKLSVIPNPLSFKDGLSVEELYNKKKEILIITRFQEVQKNIKSALRIWKKIEKKGTNGWKLSLFGYGDDEEIILCYANKLGLKHFTFNGKTTTPIEHYKRASIFMMTSKFEGFGMTLTESLQNGCVPIAFDSFSVLHDIIDDNYNGYIIPAFDENMYADRLYELMSNEDKRISFARNAIKSSEKFSMQNVGKLWKRLIQ